MLKLWGDNMVDEISICGKGYVFCKSTALSVQDTLSCENRVSLISGINENGEKYVVLPVDEAYDIQKFQSMDNLKYIF